MELLHPTPGAGGAGAGPGCGGGASSPNLINQRMRVKVPTPALAIVLLQRTMVITTVIITILQFCSFLSTDPTRIMQPNTPPIPDKLHSKYVSGLATPPAAAGMRIYSKKRNRQ